MPVEGQARRALGRRDRWLLAGLGAGGAVAIALGVLFTTGGTHRRSGTRCIELTLASTMGGATIRRCGADAARYCRSRASRDRPVAAECHRKGFAVTEP